MKCAPPDLETAAGRPVADLPHRAIYNALASRNLESWISWWRPEERIMRRFCSWFCAIAGAAAFFLPAALGQDECKAYLAIEPLDQSVLKLLGTTAVPPRQTSLGNAGFQQLRDWDFPSKVTRWSERPSPEELTRRREELIKPSPPEASRPYDLQPLPPGDWKKLEEWFAKEAAKKFPGACVDRGKATYILEMGVISDGGADRSMSNSSTRNEYNQTAGARQQDSSLGPNAATTSPVARESTAQELSGMGSSGDLSRPGAYTCAYLYRTNGGTKRSAPDFYYCKADSVMPRSAATTMLKYLAKAGLP